MSAFKKGRLQGIDDLLKNQENQSIKQGEKLIEIQKKISVTSDDRKSKLKELAGTRPVPDGRPPVIQFKNVYKHYKNENDEVITALDNINFTIEDLPVVSEMVVILGASGCGKSTILKIVAGLIKKEEYEGEILFFNEPISGPGSDRLMVFQDYSSFPWRNVLDNVAFGLEINGVKKKERYEIAKKYIDLVGLTGKEKLYPVNLSGGQKQRVAIARTLAVNSRVILMDEPFGALDISTRYEMQELLCKIYMEIENTIILVTHDISEAVYLADTIFIMSPSPGKIVEEIRVNLPRDEAGKRNRDCQEFSDFEKEIHNKMISIIEGTYGKKS